MKARKPLQSSKPSKLEEKNVMPAGRKLPPPWMLKKKE